VVTLLARWSDDGPLAETANQLEPAVDSEFIATVTDFIFESGVVRSIPQEVPVNTLLGNARLSRDEKQPDVSFRWLHLPANNVGAFYKANITILTYLELTVFDLTDEMGRGMILALPI